MYRIHLTHGESAWKSNGEDVAYQGAAVGTFGLLLGHIHRQLHKNSACPEVSHYCSRSRPSQEKMRSNQREEMRDTCAERPAVSPLTPSGVQSKRPAASIIPSLRGHPSPTSPPSLFQHKVSAMTKRKAFYEVRCFGFQPRTLRVHRRSYLSQFRWLVVMALAFHVRWSGFKSDREVWFT